MPTATVSVAARARSPWVKPIVDLVEKNKTRWVTVQEIRDVAALKVPVDQALKVYELRVGRDKPKNEWHSRREQIERGRILQVMLATITLVQHGKFLQRGRGEEKEFKFIPAGRREEARSAVAAQVQANRRARMKARAKTARKK